MVSFTNECENENDLWIRLHKSNLSLIIIKNCTNSRLLTYPKIQKSKLDSVSKRRKFKTIINIIRNE